MSNPKSKMAQIDQMEKEKHQQIQTLSDKIDAQNFKTMGIKQQCFSGNNKVHRRVCLNLPQTYVYLQVKQKCPDMGLMYKNDTTIDDEGSMNCDRRAIWNNYNVAQMQFNALHQVKERRQMQFNGLQFCPKKRSSSGEREKAYAACRAKVPFLE